MHRFIFSVILAFSLSFGLEGKVLASEQGVFEGVQLTTETEFSNGTTALPAAFTNWLDWVHVYVSVYGVAFFVVVGAAVSVPVVRHIRRLQARAALEKLLEEDPC